MVKQAEKCSIRFYASVKLNPSSLKCDEAQKVWAYKYDTYTPQCLPNEAGGYDWNKCQCSYGDSRTQTTCNCVDPSNGILIPGKSHVMDGDEDWHAWCNINCGDGTGDRPFAKAPLLSSNQELVLNNLIPNSATINNIKTDASKKDDTKIDEKFANILSMIENQNDMIEDQNKLIEKESNKSNKNTNKLIGLVFCLILIYLLYVSISKSKSNSKHLYQKTSILSDTDTTDVET